MDLSVSVLGSSSKGNCIVVRHGPDALMVDAGFSCRETQRRLAMLANPPSPESFHGLCITHGHSDHFNGVQTIARSLHIPLYANSATAREADPDHKLDWNFFQSGQDFDVGPFHLHPFRVMHDTEDPVGFRIHVGGYAIGIATDLGMATSVVREYLSGCDILLLESNHEPSLVRACHRPLRTIQRILGIQGHLCNDDCAQLLVDICQRRPPRHVLLAHLSHDCNDPKTAEYTTCRRLQDAGFPDVQVHLTYPDTPVTVTL